MTTPQNAFAAPPTRGEAVAAQLRREIASGLLPAGSPIKDAEIAARLGVSITPVRESIAVLIAEGLIDALPNKRRQVTTFTQRQAQELMDVLHSVIDLGLARIDPGSTDTTKLALLMRRIGEHPVPDASGPLSESTFMQVMDEIFALAGNSELRLIATSLLTRISGRISLYPYRHLAPLLKKSFSEAADMLPNMDEVSRRIALYFDELIELMAAERNPDEIVNQFSGRA